MAKVTVCASGGVTAAGGGVSSTGLPALCIGDVPGELGLLVLPLAVAVDPTVTPILLLLLLRLLWLRLAATMTRGTSARLRICEGSVFCFRGTGQWASVSPRCKPLLALCCLTASHPEPPTRWGACICLEIYMKAKGFYDVPLQGWEGQMRK